MTDQDFKHFKDYVKYWAAVHNTDTFEMASACLRMSLFFMDEFVENEKDDLK